MKIRAKKKIPCSGKRYKTQFDGWGHGWRPCLPLPVGKYPEMVICVQGEGQDGRKGEK